MSEQSQPKDAPKKGRIRKGIFALFAIFVVGAGAFVYYQKGSQPLESWLLKQVVAIVNTYIEPSIDFQSFAYTPPDRFRLKNAVLNADDGTTIISVDKLDLALTEVPSIGEPIQISQVALATPKIQWLELSERQVKGISPFVKTEAIKKQASVDDNVKLTNVFHIDHIKIEDGTFIFSPQNSKYQMELDGIDVDAKIEKHDVKGEEGWYQIQGSAETLPLAALEVVGTFNINKPKAILEHFIWKIDVIHADSIKSLPPILQEWVNRYEVKGSLLIKGKGELNFEQFLNSDLQFEITANDFTFAQGEFRIPIKKAVINARIQGGQITLQNTQFDVKPSGSALVKLGKIDLRPEQNDLTLEWAIKELRLEDLLREPGKSPKYAGKMNGAGYAKMNLDNATQTITGHGALKVRDAKLVNIPVFNALFAALNVIDLVLGRSGNSDKLDANFTLKPDYVKIEDFTLESPAVVARGKGRVYYDDRLDMMVNAGPIEKVGSLLGIVGKVVTSVTDKLLKYEVKGTRQEPKVRPVVLGIE